MGSKLSHVLIDVGFFSALGTSEYPGMSEVVYVRRGSPNTYDSNNGVMAVYDEDGRPWIARNNFDEKLAEGLRHMFELRDLKRGAYVPHSNDGGHFVCEILPNL